MIVSYDQLEPGDEVQIGKDVGIYAGGEFGIEGKYYPKLLTEKGTVSPVTFHKVGEAPKEQQIDKLTTSKLRRVMGTHLKAGLGAVWPANMGYASGCDPEIFVARGDGSIFPARGFLPEKRESKVVHVPIDPSTPSNGSNMVPAMYFDGLQAEFAPQAEGCLEWLHTHNHFGLQEVLNAARKMDSKAKLTIENAIQLTPEQMSKLSEEDVAFRCTSSMNVYGDSGEMPEARDYLWRFAGGHIHVGCKRKTQPVVRAIVSALDGILGVAGVSLAAELDNPERRRMYGRAGEFRLPKHGIEYRVLSNFWLCSPAIGHLVFEIMRLAVRMGESGLYGICWEGEEQQIRDIINYCDVKEARKMIDRNIAIYTSLFKSRGKFFEGKHMELALKTLLNGVEVAVGDPKDIEGNWKLNEYWPSLGRGAGLQWHRL